MSDHQEQRLGDYLILGKLGEGGMSVVYKARHEVLGRVVALKLVRPDPNDPTRNFERFRREASAAAGLEHPNIVRVYDASERDGVLYIATELVEGKTLADHIERSGRLDARQAVAIAVRVAQALDHAWNTCRIVHRDVKPDNIFLSDSGEVKLGDFGLAKHPDSTGSGLTVTGTVIGSPHYMSPEQATGTRDIDQRTDIYSLGCTLYHMIAGAPPFEGATVPQVLQQHLGEPLPDIRKRAPDCPDALCSLIAQMTAKDRAGRPSNYGDLIDRMWGLHSRLRKPGVAPEQPAPQTPVAVAVPAPPAADAPQTRPPAPAKGSISPKTGETPAPWLLWAAGLTLLLAVVVLGTTAIVVHNKRHARRAGTSARTTLATPTHPASEAPAPQPAHPIVPGARVEPAAPVTPPAPTAPSPGPAPGAPPVPEVKPRPAPIAPPAPRMTPAPVSPPATTAVKPLVATVTGNARQGSSGVGATPARPARTELGLTMAEQEEADRILSAMRAIGESKTRRSADRIARYIADLKALERAIGARADLDRAVRVRAERDAWEAGEHPAPPDSRDQQVPTELRNLRHFVERDLDTIDQQARWAFDRERPSTLRALRAMETRLTRATQLQSALALRALAARIEKGELPGTDTTPPPASKPPP